MSHEPIQISVATTTTVYQGNPQKHGTDKVMTSVTKPIVKGSDHKNKKIIHHTTYPLYM